MVLFRGIHEVEIQRKRSHQLFHRFQRQASDPFDRFRGKRLPSLAVGDGLGANLLDEIEERRSALLDQDLAKKLAQEAHVAPQLLDWDAKGCHRSNSTWIVSGGD